MPYGKPFLKWVGGKRELLPDLLRYIPLHFNTYYEPFLGGGALFWELASQGRFQEAYISDLNEELVNLYRVIRDQPGEFMKLMEFTAACYKTATDHRFFYNELRSGKTFQRDQIFRAVRFLFLNKTCFNGLHRTNKKGEFNSPWGKEVDVSFYEAENLLACAELLRIVGIRNERYSWVDGCAVAGDVVYFDPPYIPVSETSNFASYTADGFTLDDQERLARLFRRLSDRGVLVMLSNSDAPKIRELYDGFEIKIVRARRAVNSKGDARGAVNEVLVLGKGVEETPVPFDMLAHLEQEF